MTMSMLSQSPGSATSLRMPAEWEPHLRTWIAWPSSDADWPGRYGPIPWVIGEVVRLLTPHEPVAILTSATNRAECAKLLQSVGASTDRLQFVEARTDRIWTRDYGPIGVLDSDGNTIAVKWQFRGWSKYDNWHGDNEAGEIMARAFGSCCQPTWNDRLVVLEGGSIDSNGCGTLMTTEECLLSPVQQRNPGLTRADYEELFQHYLGIRKVLWLKRGIAGDDTHGHIDDIARFAGPRTVVVAVESDRSDDNYEPLQENLCLLKTMTDQAGEPLDVVELPMPEPRFFEGHRLPASYANFYIGNGIVLVPTFNDPNDRIALDRLAMVFPSRRVVGVYCGDLVWGFGAIHCMTMQQPASGLRN